METQRESWLLKGVGDATPDLIYVKDLQGRMQYCNRATAELLGRSPEALRGLTEVDWLPRRAEAEAIMALDRQVMTTGEAVVIQEVVTAPDGRTRQFRSSKSPLRDADGNIVGLTGVSSDITDLHDAMAQATAEWERLAAVLDAVSDGFLALDGDDVITHANQNAAEYLRVRRDDIIGKSVWDLASPDSDRPLEPILREVRASGSATSFEVESERVPGRFYSMKVAPLPDRAVALSFTEITDQRRSQEALRDSEARFRDLATTIDQVFYLTDVVEQRVLYLSPAYERIWGRPAAQVLADFQVWINTIHPDDLDVVREQVLQQQAGQRTSMEYRILRPDGQIRWIRDHAFPVKGAEGRRLAGLAADITDIRHAHERVVASEERFRTLAETLPAFIWMTDAQGANTYTNARYQQATGRTAAELMEFGWADVIHPDDLPDTRQTWERSLQTGEPYETSFRFRLPEGDRWYLVRGRPVRDESGAITQWIGTCTDIDEQVRTEEALRDSRARLAQSAEELELTVQERTAELVELRKLDSIGQLTGGMAHDFNNLLTPILSALDLLQEDESVPADSRLLVESALRSAERARSLVRRLLAFARRQDLQAQVIDVAELVDGMADLLTHSLGPTIRLRVARSSTLPPSLVDPHQLELALLNLCVNAKDAMPDGGHLTINLDTVQVVTGRQDLAPGEYVRLQVQDSGTGMTDDVLQQAIDPFFTTKRSGKGTGLGLSMVHGLAAQSGGGFRLSSQLGQGTTAEILLPATQPVAVPRERRTAAERVSLQGLRVLLVDDEQLVRGSLADMLRSLGHEVVDTDSPRQALDLIRDGTDFDALITDYLMPGMTGAELARRALEARPRLPVLLISGYAAESRALGDLPRLAKPFRASDLNRALADILAPNRAPTNGRVR